MFLVLCDYCVANWVIGDGVVVIEVLVPFPEVIDLEFLYGFHLFVMCSILKCVFYCAMYIVGLHCVLSVIRIGTVVLYGVYVLLKSH